MSRRIRNMAFHTDIDLCRYLWFQAACLPAIPFFDPTAVPDGGTSFVRFALPFAFRFVRSVSGGQLSSFFLMTAVSGGMTSFVRFACPFAFRFVRRVLGGLLSSCYPLVLVSYCVFRRRGFVRSFRVSFAFRFVRSVLGGLLSSCSFLSSSCPILGPRIQAEFLYSTRLWRLPLCIRRQHQNCATYHSNP